MSTYIIAYDLGTGGNKASQYDAEGHCIAGNFVAYQTQYPKAGWHEQRPADWWDAVVASTRGLLAETDVDASEIACIGISGVFYHSLPGACGSGADLQRPALHRRRCQWHRQSGRDQFLD